jgi:hypothetical protein
MTSTNTWRGSARTGSATDDLSTAAIQTIGDEIRQYVVGAALASCSGLVSVFGSL